MAAAAYPIAFFMPEQRARARIHADGSAVVQTATQEFGTGVLTMATQVARTRSASSSDAIDLPGRRHRPARTAPRPSARPASAMVGSAVHAAGARAAPAARRAGDRGRGVAAARRRRRSRSTVAGGRMTSSERPGASETYGELLARNHLADAEAMGSWRPPPLDTPHGLLTFGAQFAEVAVDPELGPRPRPAAARGVRPGRVLNPLLARSQLMGGMLWGLGQALLEGNRMDPAPRPLGGGQPRRVPRARQRRRPRRRRSSSSRSRDDVVGPLGAKGVGEIGQVGIAAAIANAVFHATGRRIRELPMAPELVMDRAARVGAARATADLRAAQPRSAASPARARRAALVVPIAALLALGAGGAERSLLVLGPLVTFSLPLVAMVAFWWEDWPGTRLRASGGRAGPTRC